MDGFNVKPEAFAFEFTQGAGSGFHVKPEAYAFELTIGNSSISTRGGFHVKPEAYAIIGDDTPTETEGFHVKPVAFAFDFIEGANSGFHVKPEAFAFQFVAGADSGFHVKPEAFAFNLIIDKKILVLRLAIRHNGKNFIVPFTTKVQAPAVVIHWNGINWYNPLVSPTSYRASAVLVTYHEEIFALSR